MSEDGIRKSAILLMSIGEDQAVEVFKYLSPREVQKLGAAMAELQNVEREQVEGVLRDFREQAGVKTNIGLNSDNYIRSVLTKALGTERATGVIDRILRGVAARLAFAPEIEITLEANPGTAEAARFAGYRAAGVNRLSMGVQSLDDDDGGDEW